MGTIQHDTELIAARVPRRYVEEIDSIARREDEKRSTIVRRLIRTALERERTQPAAAPAVSA